MVGWNFHRIQGGALAALVSLALFVVASSAGADTLLFSDDPNDFGHVAQNIGGDINNSTVACGPTSVYNSFVFLKNKYGVDLTGNNSGDTINSLENYMKGPNAQFNGVVNDNDLVNGKKQYIQDQGKSSQVVVESLVSDPNAIDPADAANFLYTQLAKGQDVEMAFFWSDKNGNRTSGGHWVTVTGIEYDTDAMAGTLEIVDPWAGSGDNSAPDITGNLSVANNKLIFGYTGGAAGNDGDTAENPDSSGYGFITGIAAESVVPLPAPVWCGLALLLGIGVGRRWTAKPVP